MKRSTLIQDIALLVLLVYVLICRSCRSMADWYATSLYPLVSGILSRISSFIPLSLDEILVVALSLVLILILVRGIRNKCRWYTVLLREARWIILIYVWFYVGWGLNYSRSSLAQRLETQVARYDEDAFKAFLADYATRMDSVYVLKAEAGADISADLRSFYASIPREAGLCKPRSWQAPKGALASRFFSKVGVTGSMGPFLSESLLNTEMPQNSYPFTAAHEFAHLMGVSSEAEANFWAFRYCEASPDASICYSGYLSLLGNVLRNARRLLSEEDYREYLGTIRREVIDEYDANVEYWSGKYSKTLGSIQNTLYNAYLKGNGISSGTKNYDEVVSLLMTDLQI